MSSNREYQIGPFWLGREPSGIYFIYWYDERKQRTKRKTTGQRDLQVAIREITRHHIKALNGDEESSLTIHQVALKYWHEHAQDTDNSGQSKTSMDRLTSYASDVEGNGPPLMADAWTKNTTKDFIAWMAKNPFYKEKKIKDKDGKVVSIKSTPLPVSDATINRAINDVRAAFRHSMDRPPLIEGIKGVQPRGGRNKPTLDMRQIKKLFAYAFATPDRSHLQTYLIAAFTTLARPEAILDISVAPEREQIEWDYRRLHLNPAGRKQRKKYRPIIPINDYLLPYLQESDNLYEASQVDSKIITSGFLVEYKGKQLAGVRQTWNRAKQSLGWPMVRDWDAKMIRHTMGKWLRAQGVPWAELEGHLGHKIPSTSEDYAAYSPDYLGRVQSEISRFLDLVFEGENWDCAPISPRIESKVVSINSKNKDKTVS